MRHSGMLRGESLWRAIEAERLSVADMLESLSPDEWEAPTPCEGWRVRDVAAHMTLATRARPLGALVGVVRAGGNPNRWVHEDAKARSGVSPEKLVADLRACAASRHRPPGTKPVDPLVDVVVHGQDIAVAVGRERAVPAEAGVTAAERAWSMPIPFRAKKRCEGVRLRADDAAWAVGPEDAPVAQGPMGAVLLVLTGRSVGLAGLSGPGVDVLASRMRR